MVRGEEPKPARPGWFGVFPPVENYHPTPLTPALDPDKKEVYSQTVRYDWMGNDFRVFELTLARNPVFKKKYDPDVLKAAKPTPTEVKVGQRTGWLSDFGPVDGITKLHSQLVVPLAADKALIIETKGTPRADMFPLTEAVLDKMVAALDQPPRAGHRRTLDLFRAIPKGATYRQIEDWVGQPESDFGVEIHVLAFKLDDDTRVRVGTSDFQKVLYIKHEDKDGKVVDLWP